MTTASRPRARPRRDRRLGGRGWFPARPRLAVLLTLALALSSAACSSATARSPAALAAPPAGHAGTPAHAAGTPAPPVAVDASVAGRLPFPLEREVALAWGRRLVLAGGIGPTGASSATVLALAVGSGATALTLALAVPTHDAGGALSGTTLLVAGGGQVASTAEVQTLRLVPGARATARAALPGPRSDLCAVPWRGGAVLAGGYDGARPTLSVVSIGPTGAAREIGRLLRGVRYAACVLDGSTLYLAGGLALVDGRWQPIRLVQAVDVRTGRTRAVGELPEPLAGASAALLDGSLYVLGGDSPSGAQDAVLGYDPRTGRFALEGRLPYPLAYAAAASFGDVVDVAGGDAGGGPLDGIVAVTAAFG